MKKILYKFKLFDILNSLYQGLVPGYKLYKYIKKTYGTDVSILYCPHKGTGDIYFIGLYFDEFLRQKNIKNYVFLFRGKPEQKIGQLFGIKNSMIIDDNDTRNLMNFQLLMRKHHMPIYDLHHYPWTHQTENTGLLEGYNNITFDDMFRYSGMEIGKNARRTLPSFVNNKCTFEKYFSEKGLIPGKTFILSPYASSMPRLPLTFWEKIIQELHKLGYTVATNSSGNHEPIIPGTVGIFFDYAESVPFLEFSGGFIGLRSGLCDIISSAKCKKIILYSYYDPDVKWLNWSGKTKKYFGLKNNLLCDDAIEYEFDLQSLDILSSQIIQAASSKQNVKLDGCFIENFNPAFKDNPIAISLVFNEWFAPYAAITIQSIINNSSSTNCYDFVLLHNGLSDINRRKLLSLSDKLDNVNIRLFDIRETFNRYSFYTEKGYNPIIYARFILPELLNTYDKIIYLDSDLILNCDIAQMYNFELDDALLAGVRDLTMIAWYNTPENPEREYINNVTQLKHPNSYINSGVLIYNVSAFNTKYSTQFLLEYASSKNWRWMDQDVFMTLCEERIKILPQCWNVLSSGRNEIDIMMQSNTPELASLYINALDSPSIIHFIGCGFLQLHNLPRWSEKYWEYAEKSIYYNVVYQRAIEVTLDLCNRLNTTHSEIDILIKLSRKLFPYNSRRREFMKKIYRWLS